jgi:hypothetical protein
MKSKPTPNSTEPVRLFISYAHKDMFWKDSLMPLLKYRNRIHAEAWSDKDITPGQKIDTEIRAKLAQMDVFVCLVSPFFAVSDYIQKVELKIARDRHKRGQIEIIPILITPPGGYECKWLNELEYLPLKGKSWVQIRKENTDYDLALQPIRDGIAKVIDRIRR